MKQLLHAIFELVGLVASHVFKPRPVMAERRVGHRGFEQAIVDAVELEREEQKMRGGRCHALLHVAVKLGSRRVDSVAGMHEAGIGAQPPHEIVDRLVAPHRRGKRRSGPRPTRHLGKLALIGFLKGDTLGVGAVEIALDRRIVEPGIKIAEIPFRQSAKPASARP